MVYDIYDGIDERHRGSLTAEDARSAFVRFTAEEPVEQREIEDGLWRCAASDGRPIYVRLRPHGMAPLVVPMLCRDVERAATMDADEITRLVFRGAAAFEVRGLSDAFTPECVRAIAGNKEAGDWRWAAAAALLADDD